jgi:hypothetical protein
MSRADCGASSPRSRGARRGGEGVAMEGERRAVGLSGSGARNSGCTERGAGTGAGAAPRRRRGAPLPGQAVEPELEVHPRLVGRATKSGARAGSPGLVPEVVLLASPSGDSSAPSLRISIWARCARG